MKIELTQDQYQQLKEFGLANSEIESYGCTHPSRGVTIDHYMTVGVKTRVTGGNQTIDNIDTTPIQVESLAGVVEWDGEGIPPVGVKCRYFVANKRDYPTDNHLREVTCVAHIGANNQLAVLVSRDFTFSTVCNDAWVRPIETEAERNERERLEAAYDLYLTRHVSMQAPYHYDEFLKNERTLDGFLAIVDKTGYRKAVTNE